MMLLAMSEKAPVLFMIKVLQKKAAATNCFSRDPADPTAFHTIPVHPPDSSWAFLHLADV